MKHSYSGQQICTSRILFANAKKVLDFYFVRIYNAFVAKRNGVTVALQTLTLSVGVRIPFPLPHQYYTKPFFFSAASLSRYGSCNYKRSRELNRLPASFVIISVFIPLLFKRIWRNISSKDTGVLYRLIILRTHCALTVV